MREMVALSLAMALVAGAAACSSGGGSGTTPSPPILSGSGAGSSGGSSDSSSSSSAPVDNVAPVAVDGGPEPDQFITVNVLYVSVTICVPGSATACQTIDHIQVDTGSSGLRILASVISPDLSLPPEGGITTPLFKCEDFADSYVWGPVVMADVHVAGETASDIPIHVVGVPGSSYPVPQDCANDGGNYAEDSIESLGAKGILGVGLFAQDCGQACTQNAFVNEYYSCTPSGECSPTTASLAQQVSNPVAFFASDNNGVIVELPAIPAAGETAVAGSLVFGIDTQSNNALGSATVLDADPEEGTIATSFNGGELPESFLDTGSAAYYFGDSSITPCSGHELYCPASPVALTATNTGYEQTGASSVVNFSIANANQLEQSTESSSYVAFDDLGALLTSGLPTTAFDWGLPFFFGRNVYVAIEGENTSGGEGPYFAY